MTYSILFHSTTQAFAQFKDFTFNIIHCWNNNLTIIKARKKCIDLLNTCRDVGTHS